jgi:hypothetical protein
MIDLNLEANRFLYNAKPGDYYISGGNKIEVTKRIKKRIYLSNGIVISIITLSNGVEYLSSKSIVIRNKSYPIVNQIIRDIEGFLLCKIHSRGLFD